MKLSKCLHLLQGNSIPRTYFEHQGYLPLPSKTQAIQKMHPPTTLKQVYVFFGLVEYYRKFIKDFTKIAKLLTLLTRQQVKLEWTPAHDGSLPEIERFHHTSTNSLISQPQQEIYSLHRYIR